MLEKWPPDVRTAYTEGSMIEYNVTSDGTGAAGAGADNGERFGPFDQLEFLASQIESQSTAAEEQPVSAPGAGG